MFPPVSRWLSLNEWVSLLEGSGTWMQVIFFFSPDDATRTQTGLVGCLCLRNGNLVAGALARVEEVEGACAR